MTFPPPHNSTYPRLLIMHTSCIYEQDPYGLFLRTLFADWPKERIAQIYTGGAGSGTPFFGDIFKLGVTERRLGRLFYTYKPTLLSSSTATAVKERTAQPVNRAKILRYKLARQLLSTGIWELVFAPILSTRLENWVRAFSPDAIYYQGGLAIGWLTLKLQDTLGIPLVFHPVDDWPNRLYRHNPIMHHIVLRTAQKMINRSSVCIAFSQRMADGYQAQFGRNFDDIIMQGDDHERFDKAEPKRTFEKGVISIVYSGGLKHRRWQSLLDVCDAVEDITADNLTVKVTAYVEAIPPNVLNKLKQKANLEILPALSHKEVPAHLKGADILLLAEPFDEKAAVDIRYSISTKAHLYMMSQTPILVYGSPEAGVVDYALRDGWGYVVPQQKKGLLSEAIRRLSTDHEMRKELIAKANATVTWNHQQRNNAERFLHTIQRISTPDRHQSL